MINFIVTLLYKNTFGIIRILYLIDWANVQSKTSLTKIIKL